MRKEPHKVIHANNMPIQAPICGETLSAAYDSPDTKMLNVYVRLNEDLVRACLEPTPYEYNDNIGMFYFADYSKVTSDDAPFYDSALMISVKYKDMTGGYYLFEFEDAPASVASGREGWGHPKLQADRIVMNDYDGVAMGSVYLDGHLIYHVELDLNNKPKNKLPQLEMEPNLLHMKHPRPDGPGTYCEFTLSRYIDEDTKVREYQECDVIAMDINGIKSKRYPFDMYRPVEILGGEYMICDYFGSEERTGPRILDRIK